MALRNRSMASAGDLAAPKPCKDSCPSCALLKILSRRPYALNTKIPTPDTTIAARIMRGIRRTAYLQLARQIGAPHRCGAGHRNTQQPGPRSTFAPQLAYTRTESTAAPY